MERHPLKIFYRELEVAMRPKEKLRRMHWIGSFLIAAGLVLLVIALQYPGNPYGWNDGHVLAPSSAGFFLLLRSAFGSGQVPAAASWTIVCCAVETFL